MPIPFPGPLSGDAWSHCVAQRIAAGCATDVSAAPGGGSGGRLNRLWISFGRLARALLGQDLAGLRIVLIDSLSRRQHPRRSYHVLIGDSWSAAGSNGASGRIRGLIALQGTDVLAADR